MTTNKKKTTRPLAVKTLPVEPEEVLEVAEEVAEAAEDLVEEQEVEVEVEVADSPYYLHPDFDWSNDSLWKDDPEALKHWLLFMT